MNHDAARSAPIPSFRLIVHTDYSLFLLNDDDDDWTLARLRLLSADWVDGYHHPLYVLEVLRVAFDYSVLRWDRPGTVSFGRRRVPSPESEYNIRGCSEMGCYPRNGSGGRIRRTM
jgi:hypothetical protein